MVRAAHSYTYLPDLLNIVTFDQLNQEEAQALADKLNVELVGDKKTYSIAEVFNQQSENAKKSNANRKVGFI